MTPTHGHPVFNEFWPVGELFRLFGCDGLDALLRDGSLEFKGPGTSIETADGRHIYGLPGSFFRVREKALEVK